jgi:hypothetical protein
MELEEDPRVTLVAPALVRCKGQQVVVDAFGKRCGPD